MRTRIVISLFVAAFVGLLASSRAGAEGLGDGYFDENGNPTVEVEDSTDATGGGESSGDPSCRWLVVVSDDSKVKVYAEDGSTRYSETGRWLQKVCDGVGPVQVGDDYIVPEGGSVDLEGLAQQARSSVSVPSPTIQTSPAADRQLLVQVPTWLWVDGGWWHNYEATASAGRVTATITARPVRAVWDLGDGSTRTCTGPGTAWRPGLPEDATKCAHTYEHSSASRPTGTYEPSVTVVFEVEWTSNVGEGGSLSSISRSSVQQVEVGEIQAVGTGD